MTTSTLWKIPSSPSQKGYVWSLTATLFAAGFLIPWKLASAYGPTSLLVFFMISLAALLNNIISVVHYRRWDVFKVTKREFFVALMVSGLTILGNYGSAAAIDLLSPEILSASWCH